MNKEDKLILGTLAGVDLVLSPEHYEEYKGTLNKQLEQKDKEIDRLNNIIDELEEYIKPYLYMLNGIQDRDIYEQCQLDDFTDIMEKLQALKENNEDV